MPLAFPPPSRDVTSLPLCAAAVLCSQVEDFKSGSATKMSQSSSSSGEVGTLPRSGNCNMAEMGVEETAASVVSGTGTNQDAAASLIAKAITLLTPDVRAQAEDPKRKASSKDPGWKYGFWPEIGKKDKIQCIFCGKQPHGGVLRFKMHLAGGYPVV
ncbi:hypothetical protein PAHAL_4G333000 [Panicum hallii]|uniref:BED-type domain-containing protein n=1 Tax=Panicum hallii TaxID=206008 RepID=A0A2T8JEV4_9POAL|nr:hypothetical protein PAHAL_4G333000 [Panicum hallii]